MGKKKKFVIDGATYEAKSTLGEGGAAVVWKVHREADGEVFAVKRIVKDPKKGSARNRRFEQEIKYGLTTRHSNLVRVYACSEDETFYYYVMDYYPMTLRTVINDESDPYVLLDYARQLCDALAHVHSEGIVHRDVKPENILVDPGKRQLVLADFGIAHFKESTLTKRDDLLVNRNYLAPEQMLRGNAHGVGMPADVFALGLVITEMFTMQNPRGRRHALVRDRYPFLADLDPIVEQMMLQDEGQRLRVDNVRGLLRVMHQRLDTAIQEIVEEMRPAEAPHGVASDDVERALGRASQDIVAAKHVFERVTAEGLHRYNPNYHCEISYRASVELFNACAQAVVYSKCRAKFEYEGAGAWDESDNDLVSSAAKPALLIELAEILADFPMPQGSLWDGLPRQSAHLFRFCKDYHCEELLTSIRESLYGDGPDALQTNLINAPILWLVRSVRSYLNTDYLELDQTVREGFGLERHVSVNWDETLPLDPKREATGAGLFAEPFNADGIADALIALELKWGVCVGELSGGDYTVMFRSGESYRSFSDEALALAEPDSVFEADVLNLLRPEAEYDDLVALTWGRDFDIAVTLGKILGTRER